MDLFTARAIRKMTQWDLKGKTQIHQSKISLFENGYVVPNEEERAAIAKALCFKVDEINWSDEDK